MASKPPGGKKKVSRRVSYQPLQKLGAGVCLLSLVVMLASGLMANNDVLTIGYRACLVMIGVKVIWRVLVSILATYEEMNSGEA